MKTNIFLYVSGLILFLYSCTNDTDTSFQKCNRIIGHIESRTRTAFINNNNVTDTYWIENDSIGIFSSIQQNVIYRAMQGGKHTEFTPVGVSLSLGDKDNVEAYYPYTDDVNGCLVKLPQTKRIKYNDSRISFMYSNSSVYNSELNLHFKHLFSYIQLKLSTQLFLENVIYMPEQDIANKPFDIQVTSDNNISISDAWFNLKQNTISYEKNGLSNNIYYKCHPVDIYKMDTLTYMIPILPQKEGTTVTVKIHIPVTWNEYAYYPIPLVNKKVPSGGFQSGCVYTINTVDTIKPTPEQFKLLEDLYNSTNGNLWRNNTYWLSDQPLNEWYGLNNQGVNNSYVNQISLENNLLTGTLPESFTGIMDCAENINLGFNGMSGDLPKSVTNHKFWNKFGWRIITQDTRLSDGFNLKESNLYISSHYTIKNVLDNCILKLDNIISRNKLTQVVFYNPSQTARLFTDHQVNLHQDYSDKGLETVLIFYSSYDAMRNDIINNYGIIEKLNWGIQIWDDSINPADLDESFFLGMSYFFDNQGQLVYFAPYFLEPYYGHIMPMTKNDIVHKKLDKFLRSWLGEPIKHDDFHFFKHN